MFPLRAFPIIMKLFWLDLGLMFIHRDIYTNRKCQIFVWSKILCKQIISCIIVGRKCHGFLSRMDVTRSVTSTWRSPSRRASGEVS
jgi:hypothetical protein